MYHLRQKEPLTVAQQNTYFDAVVAPLFLAEQPSQYLFSYVMEDWCTSITIGKVPSSLLS
jgi:hypothetical protein